MSGKRKKSGRITDNSTHRKTEAAATATAYMDRSKTMKWFKLPLVFVAVHTTLLLLTLLAVNLAEASYNPDSTIAWAIAILLYLLDFPITFLYQSSYCREFFGFGGLWSVALLFGTLGNAMWFMLGTLAHFCVSWIKRRVQVVSARKEWLGFSSFPQKPAKAAGSH